MVNNTYWARADDRWQLFEPDTYTDNFGTPLGEFGLANQEVVMIEGSLEDFDSFAKMILKTVADRRRGESE